MTSTEVKIVLDVHAKWLTDAKAGSRADFSGADLTGADLTDAQGL